ncbi:MAG TPA: serine/threonine-protein kinase [Polyangia bacterium]|nr:serine/threonine-protein kinase [Polyangia bacterium]
MDDQSLPADDEEATLPAGAKLGKYQVVRLLGAGGMGAVYEAVHTEIGKRVAVKTLAPQVAAIPGARQRFLREAQLTSRLRHPNIVDLSDMGTEGRVAYLVMELLAGEDLAARLERTGPMVPRELVDLTLPVCSALVAAHEAGIVHRDLKPQNIFLANQPQGVQPKVLDFGISKSADTDASSSLTSTGSVIGTPHYLAPEQIKDARTASAASDQYAIGVILYKCLTGDNPFEGDSIFAVLQAIVTQRAVPVGERRAGLPPGLDAVVERAMNPLPWERYPSVRELGRALIPYASPKARMIWEDTFAAGAATAEPPPEARQSHTMPMPTPQPSVVRKPQSFSTAKSRLDSGTLRPSGDLGLETDVDGLAPSRSRPRMIAGIVAGAGIAVAGFFLFARGSGAPPPTSETVKPVAASAAPAPAPPVTPPPAPAAVVPATPPPAAVAPATPKEEPKAEPEKAAVEPKIEEKVEKNEPARSAPSSSSHKHATPRHAPARGKTEAPTTAPARPALNPNGSPVID